MKNYKTKLILALICVFLVPLFVFAQQNNINQEEQEEQPEIRLPKAVAGEDQEQLVGQKVSFDGSKSENPTENKMSFRWDFGDGQFGEGEKVDYVYQGPGDYKVTLAVDNQEGQDADELTVRIF